MFKKLKNASPAAKASLAYTICNIIQKSISFLTLPLFTHLLTETQIGEYTVYLTWSAIFTIIITLNLSFGTFDKAMMEFKDEKEKYVSSIHFIVFALSFVFLAIYVPLALTIPQINSFLDLPPKLIILMVGEIIGTFAIQTWFSKEKFEYRWKWVVVVTLLIAVLAPALGYLLVKLFPAEQGGEARIYGYAFINIAVGAFFIVYNIVKGKKVYDKKFWKYAFAFNIPLIPYYFSQIIFNQSDRIMIDLMIGTDVAGIYGIAYNFALILSFVVTAVNSGYVPWLYRKIEAKDPKANRLVSVLIFSIVSVLVMFTIWVGPEAIWLLTSGKESYQAAVHVIPPVALSLILLLLSQYSINIQFYYKQKWRLVFASLFSAALNIGLNYWLIPIYGFVAAGYTTLVSYIVFAILNYICILSKVKKGGELNGIFNIWILSGIFVAFAGLSYVGYFLYPYRWVRLGIFIGMFVVAVVLAIIFRKKIMAFISKFRKHDEVKEEIKEGEENA